jgi:ferredoxin
VAHVIAQPCVGVKDTSCLSVCPANAIHPLPSEPGFTTIDQLFIDPAACLDCGNCVSACPVAAIYSEDDLPTEWHEYINKANEYYGYPPE